MRKQQGSKVFPTARGHRLTNREHEIVRRTAFQTAASFEPATAVEKPHDASKG